jgi:hypothetical protein
MTAGDRMTMTGHHHAVASVTAASSLNRAEIYFSIAQPKF